MSTIKEIISRERWCQPQLVASDTHMRRHNATLDRIEAAVATEIERLQSDKRELVNCLRDIQNSIDVYRDANGIRRGRPSFSWHLIDVIQILIDRHADNTDTHKNNKKDDDVH